MLVLLPVFDQFAGGTLSYVERWRSDVQIGTTSIAVIVVILLAEVVRALGLLGGLYQLLLLESLSLLRRLLVLLCH